MIVTAGQPFTTSLVDPAGDHRDLGARVEVPVSRAIASARSAAVLDGSIWTVTLDAPLTPGDYLLVWQSSEGVPSYETFIPLTAVSASLTTSLPEFPPIDVGQVTPEVGDVAALEGTRTVDESGEDVGTFNESTTPTAQAVTDLIGRSIDPVLSQLPDRVDPRHYGNIRYAISLYVARIIEGSYYRNQAEAGDTGRAPSLWRDLYNSTMSSLEAAIEADTIQAVGLV